MKVMCLACHTVVEWPRNAGEKLIDYECPKCGGKLQPHWCHAVQEIYTSKEWYGLDGTIVPMAKRKVKSVVDMVKDSAELALGVIEWKILDAIQKRGGDYPTYREIGVLTALDLSLITKPLTYLASRDIVQGSHSPDHGGEKVYLLTRKGKTVMAQRAPSPPIPVAPTDRPTITLDSGQTLTVDTPVVVAPPVAVDPLPFRCEFSGCTKAFASQQGLSHHKTASKHWNTSTGVKPSRIQQPPEPTVKPLVEPIPQTPVAPLVEDRKFKCPVFICDVSCATKEGLERHKETVHPGLCPICEDDYGSVRAMLIHKGIVHKSKIPVTGSVLNIAELLKVDSFDQIAVVKADIEVIDQRGSEYQITITRTNKGLILTKQILEDIIDMVDAQREINIDMLADAGDDEAPWMGRWILSAEAFIEKVRKEADIPKKEVQ